MKTKVVSLFGGPYSGEKLRISETCHSTLIFSIGDMKGHYYQNEFHSKKWHWEDSL